MRNKNILDKCREPTCQQPVRRKSRSSLLGIHYGVQLTVTAWIPLAFLWRYWPKIHLDGRITIPFTKSDYTEIAVTPIIGKNPKGIAHSYNGFCWAEISLPKLAHLGKINKKCFVALFSASQPDKMSCPRTLIPCVQRGKPKGYLMTCRSWRESH